MVIEVPITVAIPALPTRTGPGGLLEQAIDSVRRQTVTPAGGISVVIDTNRDGAAITRQRALNAVETDFVSYLDDDDILHPHHLETHWALLRETGADVAYSWFDGNEPFGPQGELTHRGKVWNPEGPHHITMTITVRTALAKQVGFTPHPDASEAIGMAEDWVHILGLNALGARFVGTGIVTWTYRVHSGNTSGLATRW